MIETLLYFALAFGGGVYVGHETSTVITECRDNSLITTQCTDPLPPKDDTFGETTNSYISLVDQYKKCQTACIVKLP